ncbi:MAG: hypothetical protein GY851_03320 [bacterium]|nr:hypothetical protein [bacterium]
MALSSSSTITDALAQYNDNLRYRGDATKAVNLLEAIEFLLVNRPSQTSADPGSLSFESLKEQKEAVEKEVNAMDGASRRTHFVQGRPLYGG